MAGLSLISWGIYSNLQLPTFRQTLLNRRLSMTVQHGALRCKDGDLALVINYTIDCRQNIGHIVQIRGPARMLKQSGMLGWLIKPLHKRVWGVTELDGRNVKERVFWSSGVFHEDAWLMPIRPQSTDEVWQELQPPRSRSRTSNKFLEVACQFDSCSIQP